MSGAPATRAILVLSYIDGVLPLTAPNLISSFAVERCGAAGWWLAIQRRTRSELLLADFIFIGSGERVIHSARQHASLAAVRTSAR